MTIEEFKKNPPKAVRVYDPGTQRNLNLRLSENEQSYTTGNMGTPSRRVFHIWSFENAFKARIS